MHMYMCCVALPCLFVCLCLLLSFFLLSSLIKTCIYNVRVKCYTNTMHCISLTNISTVSAIIIKKDVWTTKGARRHKTHVYRKLYAKNANIVADPILPETTSERLRATHIYSSTGGCAKHRVVVHFVIWYVVSHRLTPSVLDTHIVLWFYST